MNLRFGSVAISLTLCMILSSLQLLGKGVFLGAPGQRCPPPVASSRIWVVRCELARLTCSGLAGLPLGPNRLAISRTTGTLLTPSIAEPITRCPIGVLAAHISSGSEQDTRPRFVNQGLKPQKILPQRTGKLTDLPPYRRTAQKIPDNRTRHLPGRCIEKTNRISQWRKPTIKNTETTAPSPETHVRVTTTTDH